MLGKHFYYQHTRKAVAVFGTLFNNITVVKRDQNGDNVSSMRVPLSYGPKEKFLARIEERDQLDDPRLAIRLPRMSFEMSSLVYDSEVKLQRTLHKNLTDGSRVFHPVTYTVTFDLNILTKHTDDGLQILEQILPHFQPEYTVSVREIDNDLSFDMPFILTSVSMQDDYEGDFNTRRAIIYTLSFETKVRYYGPIFEDGDNVIKRVKTSISDISMTESGEPYSVENIEVSPLSAGPDDEFQILTTYDAFVYDNVILNVDNATGFEIGESIFANISGATGRIVNIDNNSIRIAVPDEKFQINETIIGDDTSTSATIESITPLWNTSS